MNLRIEGTTIYKETHVDRKGENVDYYSVCVFYRRNNFRDGISSDWIAAIDGKLMTESDCYVDYHDEYYLEDFPVEEIHNFQDISKVNSYYTSEDKRSIYELFTEQLSSVLKGHENELAAILRSSL